MSVVTSIKGLSPGRYQIYKGISKSDLESLVKNPATEVVQFSSMLTEKEIDMLENIVFSKRPDILLRVYDYSAETTCDLGFIQQIPSLRGFSADCLTDAKGIESVTKLEQLEYLGVGISNLESFDFLDKINPNLKELYLHNTRSKKPEIHSIERFSKLKHLYLEGQQKGIESIVKLKNLEKIVLRSISTSDIGYLKNLDNLWSVDIKLGGIKDLSDLASLKSLKYLELWQVRDLNDLSFVSNLQTLQNLFIQSLKQVTELPDLSNNRNLRRIFLENMKGLKDLSALKNAPGLKEFIYAMATNQDPENLMPVLLNPSVDGVLCMLGSRKKNIRFEELTHQYNKSKYTHSAFDYV